MTTTEVCTSGILSSGLGMAGQVIDRASINDGRRDNHFIGSFCPNEPGFYRLLYKGDTDSNFENQFSSYSFNNVTNKERTTSYFQLSTKTCYPYKFIVSIEVCNKGELYYQKEGESEKIVTKDVSYSCSKILCFNGSKDPQCYIPKISCNQEFVACRSIIQLCLIYVIES